MSFSANDLRQNWQVSAAILILFLLWLSYLPSSRTDMVTTTLVPFAVFALALLGYLFVAAAAERKWAIGALLGIVTVGLTLSFRVRDPGDIGPDWQNGLKALIWSALVLVGIIRWQALLTFIWQPVPALLALHCGIAFLSAFWSSVPLYTAASAVGLFAYLSLAGLLAIDIGANQTLKILLWSLFGFIVMGIVSAIILPDLAWMPPSIEETEYRLAGLAGHPNNFGHYIGIFLLAVLVCFERRLISTIVMVGLLTFGILILYETGSRTIVVALVATLSAIGLRKSPYGPHLLLAAIGVATLILGLLVVGGIPEFVDILKYFSRSGSNAELLTLTGRTELWSIAVEKIAEKPLFGWGFNGTEAIMAESVGRTFYGSAVNAHNMYLQIFMSLGLIGSTPILIALGLLIRRFLIAPDMARDAFILLCVFNGLAEAEIFATPALSILITFWVVARDAVHHSMEFKS